MLYNNNCSAAQRESVIGPALSPLQDEFISNCSKTADSGIVSHLWTISESIKWVVYINLSEAS